MRLIDADALFDAAFEVWGKETDGGETNLFMEMINNAPTIAPPPNDTLTLEEMLEMEGEPVWTITIGMEGSGYWELCTCEVVTACPLHKVLRCVTGTGEVTDYEIDTYDNTWLAYRHKPKEGTT